MSTHDSPALHSAHSGRYSESLNDTVVVDVNGVLIDVERVTVDRDRVVIVLDQEDLSSALTAIADGRTPVKRPTA